MAKSAVLGAGQPGCRSISKPIQRSDSRSPGDQDSTKQAVA